QPPNSGGGIPTPEVKPFQLTGARNLSLVDVSGKEVALNDLIKGKTLILDFSSDTCGYCITEAQKLNASPSMQASFDDAKCTIVTVTQNQNDLAAWARRFTGTYAAKHSYGLKSAGMMDVIRNAFGAPSPGTPTYLVVTAD